MERKVIDASVTEAKRTYSDYLVKELFDNLKTKGSPSFLSDWTAVKFICEDTCGKVFKAVHGEGDNMQVSAINIIEAMDTEPLNEFFGGLCNLLALNDCSNIVHTDDHALITLEEPNMPKRHFLAIRTEYLQPIDAENFPKSEIPKLAGDICGALAYCHGQDSPVVHCDVKPENIFTDGSGNYKLAVAVNTRRMSDFDISSSFVCGTPLFMPPGLLANDEYNTPLSDLYSLGCTLYALYNRGRVPFWNEFLKSLDYKQQGEVSWIVFRMRRRSQPVPRIKGVKPGMMTIITRLCHYSADERLSSAEEAGLLFKAIQKRRGGLFSRFRA